MSRTLLAGLTPDVFLRRYWQKRPLFAREALPAARTLLTREALFRLAMRDDVEARLVTHFGRRWEVGHGPFTRRDLSGLPPRDWTLLVQGVNHVLPQAGALLHKFSFIPYARLDDLMVSYAPLRLLRNFRAASEWRLAPGDMLYLPPRCAHEGIAIDHCLSASIGFRAPDAQELGARFLEFLADHLSLAGGYTDPGLRPTSHPARIGDDLLLKSCRSLARIRWSRRTVLEFLGCHLTEPKPHVRFERPARPVGLGAFTRLAASRGVRLDIKTLMLYSGRLLFINGSSCSPAPPAATFLRRLADRRRIAAPARFNAEAARWLYQWYRSGYIGIGSGHAPWDGSLET